MKKKLTTVDFNGTKEQETALRAVIAEYRGTKGAMMPVLQKAQDIYGYLPIEVQKIIADEMDTSLEEVYGITTFYSQFALNPKGKYVKGAQDLVDRITLKLGLTPGSTTPDGKYSLDATRCIGACGLAPVLTVNDEVYGRLTKEDIDGIRAKYVD